MMRLRSLFAANVNRRRVCSVTSGVAYRMSAPVTDGFRRPRKRSSNSYSAGGAAEISRWWSEAQPPGQVIEDYSRPGRDAGIALMGKTALVLRPFRARFALGALPVVALSSTTG
jgi:hypothetical protein